MNITSITSQISIMAFAGKMAIDHTELHPFAKVAIKWSIDRVADFLKKASLPSVEDIQSVAQWSQVDQVIALPLVTWQGEDLLVIRAYGPDSKTFIEKLGLQILPMNDRNRSLLTEIDQAEKNLGVLIYQKKTSR